MCNLRRLSLLLSLAGAVMTHAAARGSSDGQSTGVSGASLSGRLGFPPGSRMVMVHADDAGVTHSVNQAIQKGFENGSISSASIIVPAPWFPEIAAYAKAHPEYDFGLHLALTSEWTTITDPERGRGGLRWGGVASRDRIPSLLDPEGFLWSATKAVTTNVRPEEARIELRAQIERAKQFGVPFTHFDTHMGAPAATPELQQVFLDLAREYNVLTNRSTLQSKDSVNNPVLAVPFPGADGAREWAMNRYRSMIAAMRPDDVTRIIIHPGFDNDELRAAMGCCGQFGSAARWADYEAFSSPSMRAFLKEQQVQLISYKHVKLIDGTK
jgi:chitin disaccharide deacetylase